VRCRSGETIKTFFFCTFDKLLDVAATSVLEGFVILKPNTNAGGVQKSQTKK
jgi:hypothetical protein